MVPQLVFGGMVRPEVVPDGDRDERLDREDRDDAHEGHQAVHLQVGHRIRGALGAADGCEHREPDDDQRRDHRLRGRGDERAAMSGMRATERARQHLLTAEREQVARGRVVERHATGERSGDDQVAHHIPERLVAEPDRRNEEEVQRIVVRRSGSIREAVVAGDRRP